MKKLAAVIMSIALAGGGAVVGWELKQWHTLIATWGEKAAAFDFVGPEIMGRIMTEIARQRILEEREVAPAKVPVSDSKQLPTYRALKRGEYAS